MPRHQPHTSTVHEVQMRWKHAEFCSQMLHITPSDHQYYTLIFLPRLLPVKLLLMSVAWISDPPFSGTSHTSVYIVAASKMVSPKLTFRQHCLKEISCTPKAWLWIRFEKWKYAVSIPKKQGKYMGHRETRKVSPPTITVAGSHLKHRSTEGSLGAFWNFIKRCICSYIFL